MLHSCWTARRASAPSRRPSAGIVAVALLLLALPGLARGAAPAAPSPGMAAGDSLYALGNFAAARAAYEAVTAREPENGRAWYRLGLSAMGQADYAAALPALTRSEAIGHNPAVMYNLACVNARLGHPDTAFDWLGQALAGGLPNPEQFLADPDLAALKGLPRYAALAETAHRAASPCTFLPQARQFDFWLGDWDVRTPAGQVAGHNLVQAIISDCVIQENWTGSQGGSGKSVNFYNAATGHWEQIWMDNVGGTTHYVGDLVEGVMRFHTETTGSNGQVTLQHLSFFPLAPDHVRQLSESSTDNGKTWSIAYDLHYFKKSS